MELAFKKLPVIVIWLYLILNSCSSKTEIALDWSEGNRAELEKVLIYYREEEPNELKLKAAEYLISNMLFQYTQVGPGVDSLNVEGQRLLVHSKQPLVRSGVSLVNG